MSKLAETEARPAEPSATPTPTPSSARIPSGILPFDERTGGLEPGGSYLVVGAPGPAKMVAALQFLHAGVAAGEPALLLTNVDADGILGVARAWGFDLKPSWKDGKLRILGFKDDFELRAIRSVEPEEVIEELDGLVGRGHARIAIDPGTLFLSGGARSLLGASFLKWSRAHSATVWTTFSVDGSASALPSSAEWMLHATTGRLAIEWRAEELYEITQLRAIPGTRPAQEAISVQLKPGAGLVLPEGFPARRGRDRPGVDRDHLLLVSLGGAHAADVEAWASASFTADVVSEPFEAVARAQADASFGAMLIHAPRARIREAVQACRALRPLTRAAIVFASDDAIRSTDRINILEAGADDCLSGGIDFRELDLRIRQAIDTGSKPVPEENGAGRGAPTPGGVRGLLEGGRVTEERLREEVVRRSSDPVHKFFCFLDVVSEGLETERLEELLAEQVRADEGDLVSGNEDRCAVLLQGARAAQLDPFLGRLHARLREAAKAASIEPDATVGVMSHPADADRIRTLMGIAGDTES